MNVTYLPGQQATFSGQLYNQIAPVANQSINLSGVVPATTKTDSQGNFSTTASIPQLGAESAASADGNSNTAQVAVQASGITISGFSVVSEGNGLWLISGTVGGDTTQGAVVNFGGINAVQGQSTEVNADGTFQYYVTIPPGQEGWITAQAVDWWGDMSQIAMTCPQP